MGWYTVKQGDHVSSIAKQYGFDDFKKIWDNPANAELKAKRGNPNVLLPGDRLFIPDLETKQFSRPTDHRHPFKLVGPRLELRIVLEKGFYAPIASNDCPTWIDSESLNLTTDQQGLMEHNIKKTSVLGRVLIKDFVPGIRNEKPADWMIKLKIGYLDPVDSTSGQQGRLINLGYYRGTLDTYDPDEMRSAVEEFQCDHGEHVDGICGPNTQGKLQKVYGC